MSIALYTELGIIIDINSLLKTRKPLPNIVWHANCSTFFYFDPDAGVLSETAERPRKKKFTILSLHCPPSNLRGCLATGICATVIETESPTSNMVYQPQPQMIIFFSSPNIPGPGTSISSILDERRAIHTRLADYRMSVNFSSTRSYTK